MILLALSRQFPLYLTLLPHSVQSRVTPGKASHHHIFITFIFIFFHLTFTVVDLHKKGSWLIERQVTESGSQFDFLFSVCWVAYWQSNVSDYGLNNRHIEILYRRSGW